MSGFNREFNVLMRTEAGRAHVTFPPLTIRYRDFEASHGIAAVHPLTSGLVRYDLWPRAVEFVCTVS